MKNNFLEHLILYILVACVALAIATLVHGAATLMGFDSFTAFMVFVVVLGIEAVVYLSIHVIIQEWIWEGLSKMPYFKDKIKIQIDKMPEDIGEQHSLENIRNEQLQNKAKKQAEKLNVALDYTRKTFAPYVFDEHIELLCSNLKAYADKLSLETLYPVKTGKGLSTIDVFSFRMEYLELFQSWNSVFPILLFLFTGKKILLRQSKSQRVFPFKKSVN
jgi:hypothetical protein